MSTSPALRLRLLLAILAATAPEWAAAQQAPRRTAAAEDPSAAEEKRQEETAKRFLALLEKTPRKGTALDRVYGYHVERGTLDAFAKTYADRAAADPKDGVAWMVLGLVEGQRGRDAASVEALRKAEEARPEDPLPSYYLGQALVLVGQPEEAAAAFERALERKPARNDLLEVFQALGRVYQRTQKTEEALGVWKRLEALFPNDQRVQEQIAAALAEEGQSEAALGRYEALAKKASDPFRRVQFGMQAADLKVRLGRSPDALADFEKLLGQLRPDSWLYREARQKTEEVFLRSDDRAGLADYYQKWIAEHPEDVDALVRLGRSLAAQGRASASQEWFQKAVKLAPSRKDLRLALVGQLLADQKFAEAADQYRAMDEASPNDPDVLREWGGLLLRDVARPEAQRKADAGAVWRRMLEARPKDPVVAAQVADLFRQADLQDDALALYRKAVELAPGDAQYYEYLGEYLHTLKRPDEARAAWSKIAEPPRRDAKNLTRLGEVLAGFGYLSEAVGPLDEAVKLAPDEFTLRLKLADLLHKASRHDEAGAQLDAAERLAEKDEEKSAAVEALVKNDLAAGRIAEKSEAIRKGIEELEAAEAPAPQIAERWARLARYLEAEAKVNEAVRAAEKAAEVDPKSIPAWALAARLRESSGDLGGAADAYRRLAEVDRRNRGEYLTGIAKLEARLGRAEEALKAGRDLIAAAPGNPESYQFYSDLCFQLGRNDEGLDALRRAVRIDPNDVKTALALAENLAGQYRTDEAVEIFWKAFEKADDLDAKVGMVARLADLYLQRNQFDRLLARLQGDAQDNRRQDQQREQAVCLAQAYASSGDLGQARAELEKVLSVDARDPRLIQQVVKLSEEEGDFEGAVKYQKQLVELAPADDALAKLAALHVRMGEIEEAQAIWSKLAAGKAQPDKVFAALDSLLTNDRPKAALEVAEALVRKDPGDWEAVYRQGVALMALKRPEEAAARFRALLDLRGAVADDAKSAQVKARARDPKLAGSAARTSATQRLEAPPIQERVNAVYRIRIATGIEARDAYVRSQPASWSPQDFGQARISALGWLFSAAMKDRKEDEALAAFREAKDRKPADANALWDWYWLCQLRFDYPDVYRTSLELSKAAPSDPSALWALLTAVGNRRAGTGQRAYVRSGQENVDRTPPLPPEELEHLLTCYNDLRRRRPELVREAVLQNVQTELKRAKREADGDRLFAEAVASADQIDEVTAVLSLAGQRGDVESIRTLSDKLERLQPSTSPAQYGYVPSRARAQAAGLRLLEKKPEDALRLMEDQFAANRRSIQRRPPGRSRPASSPSSAYVQIWKGRSTNSIQLAFPTANEWLDAFSIGLLRTVYEGYKKLDLSSDLAAHLRKLADAAESDVDAVIARLALSSVLWWDDDRDAAVAEFTKAVDRTRADSDLRLVLAELLEQRGDPAEALAVVDGVKPLDNATTQRREEQALRLAILAGDLDRARKAAERLFGLRLDTDTQVRLAGQMGRLGLAELGEAVLSRARRRAGNKAASLVGLMLQYQQQQKTDAAVQVAQQILRTSSPAKSNNAMYGTVIMSSSSASNPEQARASAIQVLARSGKLDELIQRAKDQIEATPNSVQLHQTLADYYKAANRRDEARSELMKILELRPDDAALRYQVAVQLAQEGKNDAAVEQYTAAIQKDPSLLGRNYYQVMNAFQAAGKADALSKLLEEADLRAMGNSSGIMNMIQNMSYDETQKARVVPLFRKAWDAFPSERANLLHYIHQEEIWKLPEMYDYAVEVAVPDPTVGSNVGEWAAFETGVSFRGNGQVTGLVSRLLEIATAQNRAEDLSRRIEAGLAKVPDWNAGKALLALVDCRAGKFDEARKRIEEVLARAKDEPLPSYAPHVLGSELEKYGPTRDLAIRVYESGLADPEPGMGGIVDQYEYSPLKRLVTLYARDGRKDDARRLLISAAKPRDMSGYDDDYQQQMRVGTQTSVGRELLALGFASDAAPILNEARAGAEAVAPDAPNYYADRETLLRSARESLDEALKGLKGADLARAASSFLAVPAADAKPRVDLILMVYPRDLDRASVRSLFAESIESAAASPDDLRAFDAPLDVALKAAPGDVTTAVAAALTALAGGKAEAIRPALDRLGEALAKSPMEPLAPGARANARQRDEAMRRVPLWLVARACRKSPAFAADGDRLAEAALEAAGRQSDPLWSLAMLREQGEQALGRGDRAAAEAAWGRMLDSILAGDAKKKPEPARTNPAAPPGVAPPAATVRPIGFRPQDGIAPAAPSAPPPGRLAPARPAASGVPLLTIDRVEQAMQVAKLAAENGMFDLSARAVRESLKGGPPAVVQPAGGLRPPRMVVRNGVPLEPPDPITSRVVARFLELDPAWSKHKAPADLVYRTLLTVVAPEARPGELFLYAQPFGAGGRLRARSVGALLAGWSVRAGRADELIREAEARGSKPSAAMPALVLKAQVATAAGRDADLSAALAAIHERLKTDTLRASTDLAMHAALPALDRPGALKPALAVMEVGAKAFGGGGDPENNPAGPLMLMIARRHFDAGDVESARRRLDSYAETLERDAGVYYGGDYALYVRKNNLRTVAGEYARVGDWSRALEQLGNFVDAPSYSGGEPDLGDVLVRTLELVAAAPPAERYAALKAWTLPAESRRLVRILSTGQAGDRPPPPFATPAVAPREPVASTATALIHAAAEAGKLDELLAESRAAAEQKLENAEDLHRLVALAAGKFDEFAGRLEERRAELARENASPREEPVRGARQKPRTFPWPDYFAMREALRSPDPKARATGLALAAALEGQARRYMDSSALGRVRLDLAAAKAEDGGAPSLRAPAAIDVPLWHPFRTFGPGSGPSTAIWAADRGLVTHLADAGADRLAFEYPLTGEFELSFEAFRGASADAYATYATLLSIPATVDDPEADASGGRAQETWKHTRYEDFDRVTIKVAPGSHRLYLNGHLMMDDPAPSPTVPWLTLGALGDHHTAWRNFTLKGSPTIPREVRLVDGDRMDGWASAITRDATFPRPKPKAAGARARLGASVRSGRAEASTNPEDYDWSAEGGVLLGRKLSISGVERNPYGNYRSRTSSLAPGAAQSLLTYERPLRAGDVVNYAFYCDPDEVMVHPALGRTAFLLEPGGVRLHWTTSGSGDFVDVPTADAVDVPEHRRGDGPPPLKPGDWNAVALTIGDSSATLELNGVLVYEHPITPQDDLRFGLYRDKDKSSVQVRDVVLKGRWPESLSDADRAAIAFRAPAPDRPEAERRVIHDLIGEEFLSRGAEDQLAAAAPLAAEARYRALADWVLPAPGRPLFRLAGDTTTTDPAPPAKVAADSDGPRARSGGEVRVPAIAMAEAAAEAGKLDELAARIDAAPAEDDAARRGKLALKAIVAVVRGDAKAADAALGELKPLLEASAPDQPEWSRSAELAAATAAVDRKTSVPAALPLLDLLATRAQPRDDQDRWKRRVKGVRSRALLASTDAGSPPADAPGSPWAPSSLATAETRGRGFPAARWIRRGEDIVHLPGHAHDYLYLATPLAGDFQVDCELTSFDFREARVTFGGLGISPRYDLKHVDRFTVGGPWAGVDLAPPLEPLGDWYAYRLVVRGDRVTAFVNGRQILETNLPPGHGPWLALQADQAGTAGVRNLRIAGSPTIPERIDLSAAPDLSGWLAGYYNESIGAEESDWSKRGDEIVGRRSGAFAGSKCESVLIYNRPMVEDGEVSYEFFYEPSEAATHPALDRLTFLLEPDGVKLHWMTDDALERTGLDPGNASPVPPDDRRGPASLPLKEKDWNRVVVAIAGDRATVRLNDVEVVSRALEPTNRRTFGLFHYADEAEARVRNVSYTGRWPRSLPAEVVRP